MPTIRFTKDYQVKGVAFVAKRNGQTVPPEHANDSPLHPAGSVLECSESYANKYVHSRGVAEYVTPKGTREEKKPPEAPK